jgi:Brp/Blh family beta-carotene 15,15'-monooxygenase
VAFLLIGCLQVLLGLDTGAFRLLPLLLGLFLFGLPHGAIDHLVALGLARRAMRPRPLGVVVALYLAVVLAVLLLWWVTPPLAALGFLIMTIFHWGKADIAFERLSPSYCDFERNRLEDYAHLALRGLIPIGLPFLAFPDQASEFINACIQLFMPGIDADWGLWRRFVLGLFLVLFLFDGWTHVKRIQRPAARRLLLETWLLTGFFCFVSPLVAIGWYFVGWHGCRHFLRLCSYEPSKYAEGGTTLQRMRLRNWQALPFTLVSVAMLFGLSALVWKSIESPFTMAALYLVLISALTLPHLMIVEWMDRREGV